MRRLLLVVSLAALAIPATAQARKVETPGPFDATVLGGTIGTTAVQVDLGTVQPPPVLTGAIEPDGSFVIPPSGWRFDDIDVKETYKLRFIPVGNVTGTVDPLTRKATVTLRARLEIRGGQLGTSGSCRVGSDANPIDLGTLSSDAPEGVPYDAATGKVTVATKFTISQGASGCLSNSEVNKQLGLPSSGSVGDNPAVLALDFEPAPQRGITASFTHDPASGVFDASASKVTGTPSYQWDVDDDGDVDATGRTPQVTFAPPGFRDIRLHVSDGVDFAEAVDHIFQSAPDLSVASSHDGDFRVGSPARYTIAVRNRAGAGPSGPLTVVDTLPAGLAYSGSSGPGWSCSALPAVVTCTRTASIPAGSTSELRLDVNPTAPGSGVNAVTVSTPYEAAPADDHAQDPTTVTATDLRLAKTHLGVLQATQSATYRLLVTNEGTAATVGDVTVVDQLPAGLAYDAARGAGGPGFACSAAGRTVTCRRTAAITPGQTIAISVPALVDAGAAGATVVNSASVGTGGDVDVSDNEASDSARVFFSPDLTAVSSHSGDFVAGRPGVFRIDVTNVGVAATAGTLTVTDELPDGLTYVSGTGDGWSCSASGARVTCTSSAVLAPGASAPPLTLGVAVGAAAVPEVGHAPSVSYAPATPLGDPDPNAGNDAGEPDVVLVREIDAALRIQPGGAFRVGQRTSYSLVARNAGSLATSGPVRVTHTVPAGLTPATPAAGSGWDCSAGAGREIDCTRSSPLAAGASGPPILVTVDVGLAAAPAAALEARVSTPEDSRPANDADTLDMPVTQVDLGVAVDAATPSWRVGDRRGLNVAVTNEGTPSTGPVAVTYRPPAGIAYDGFDGAGWSCAEAAGLVTCTRAATVPAGPSALPVLTLWVQVGAGAWPGPARHEVGVATAGDTSLADNAADVSVPVVAPDLRATADHERPVRAGGWTTVTLGAENVGDASARGSTTLTATLPAGLTPAGAPPGEWSCDVVGRDISCERSAAVPAGGEAELAIRARVAPGATAGTVAATVSTSGDPQPSNDDASDVVSPGRVDLRPVAERAPGAIAAGDVVAYALSVRNDGDLPSDGPIGISFDAPGGFSVDAATGPGWRCERRPASVACETTAAIPAGAASAPIVVETTAGRTSPASGALRVSSSAEADPSDDDLALNESVSLPAAAPDLGLSVAFRGEPGGWLRVGATSAYVVTARNGGALQAPGPIAVRIPLPAGLRVAGETDGWACDGTTGTVTCTSSGGLAPRAQRSLRLPLAPDATSAERIAFTATLATASGAPADDAVRDESRDVRRVDLAATLDRRGDFAVGGKGALVVAVRNAGTAATDRTSVAAVDLPDGLAAVGAGGDGWSCALGATVRCRRDAAIEPGATAPELIVDTDVARDAAGELVAVAKVSTPDDVDATNDAARHAIVPASATGNQVTLIVDAAALTLPARSTPIGLAGAGREIRFSGTLDGAALDFPAAGVQAPPLAIPGVAGVFAQLVAAGDGKGRVEDSGAVTLDLPLRVAIVGSIPPEGCGVGTAADPIRLALTTGTSGAVTGEALSGERVTLVDGRFATPAAGGCGGLDSIVNSTLGLPVPSGATLRLSGRLIRGVAPAPSAPDPEPSAPAPPASPPADKRPPVIQVRATTPQALNAIRLTVRSDEKATATVGAALRGAGKVPALKPVKANLSPAKPAAIRLRLPKTVQTRALRSLRARGRVSLLVSVRAVDPAGNATSRKATIVLRSARRR